MGKGFMGKVLWVDLDTGKLTAEPAAPAKPATQLVSPVTLTPSAFSVTMANESEPPPEVAPTAGPPERVVRLNADNLNRLLGLAG